MMPKTAVSVVRPDLRRSSRIRSYIGSYAMVIPAILFLLIFTVYPMLNLIQISLYRGNAANAYKKYVGLENYRQLLPMCMEAGVPIIVNTDSPDPETVGDFALAEQLLKEIGVPDELILNNDIPRLKDFLLNP